MFRRKDDFAWENDRITYRMYGPALQKDGEISSGVDVWVKRVENLILDEWYKPGVDYHTDHGEGLDYYKVGPSRGCGGNGIWDGKKLHVSKNFIDWKILANGTLRPVFVLEYAPWYVNEAEINEAKRITLDAGSQLNKFETRMQITGNAGSGKVKNFSMAIGIVDRGEGGDLRLDQDTGIMRYWEPQHEINGSTGCAVVVQPEDWQNTTYADKNHLLLVKLARAYYAGACWNKNKNFPEVKAWDAYLEKFVLQHKMPLLVEIDKKP